MTQEQCQPWCHLRVESLNCTKTKTLEALTLMGVCQGWAIHSTTNEGATMHKPASFNCFIFGSDAGREAFVTTKWTPMTKAWLMVTRVAQPHSRRVMISSFLGCVCSSKSPYIATCRCPQIKTSPNLNSHVHPVYPEICISAGQKMHTCKAVSVSTGVVYDHRKAGSWCLLCPERI